MTIKKLLAYTPLFFPLYLVRFKVGPIPTNLLELIILILLVGLAVNLTLNHEARKQFIENLLPRKNILIACSLIVVAGVISVIIVPGEVQGIDGPVLAKQISLGILKGWLLIPMAYFVAILGHKPDDKWKKTALASFVIIASLLSLWAIYQVLTGKFATIDNRASGPFESANYLALFIAPALIICLAFIQSSRKSKKFWAWLILCLIIGLGLTLTLSYGAFIAAAAGIGLWLIYKEPNFKNLWSTLLAVIGLGLLVFLSQLGSDKLDQLFNPTAGGSTSVRLEIYQTAITLIKNNPIFGLGLGQFDVQYPLQVGEIIGRHPLEWAVLHPHNLLLATWLNGGILMVIGFLMLIISAVKSALTKLTPTKKIALTILVVILVHGLVDTPYWKNDLAYLWWLTFALML